METSNPGELSYLLGNPAGFVAFSKPIPAMHGVAQRTLPRVGDGGGPDARDGLGEWEKWELIMEARLTTSRLASASLERQGILSVGKETVFEHLTIDPTSNHFHEMRR